MEYLKSAVALLSLIKETNTYLLQKKEGVAKEPNQMLVKVNDGKTQNIVMDTFSNDFVNATLGSIEKSEAFVITDLVSMDVKGKELTYILYKGYHSNIEKGLVLYQVVDNETLKPLGELQFSNMEENIFYAVDVPQVEESSCNAMETDKKVVENGKSIVFLIGHMKEQRLVYDIQRLIFDTVNNVSKHEKLKFGFIIHITHFGGSPSPELREEVKKIEIFTEKYIYPEYPNAIFKFSYEQDGSLN